MGWWAHPRSRGENRRPLVPPERRMGSSPLTRGKPLRAQLLHGAAGLIPAHAGKTRETAFLTGATTAHPRSRGENVLPCGAGALAGGSSPLTRGKHLVVNQAVPRRGLIPAHAGKTSAWSVTMVGTWAHPRSRGENTRRGLSTPRLAGSSPLTRGKHSPHSGHFGGLGLIPAHAGKTRRDRRSRALQRAHPRSRGENPTRAADTPSLGGSSPLTRGKLWRPPGGAGGVGLIPAHAGKTWTRGNAGAPRRAHPRSRGENLRLIAGMGPQLGSSPLTRGKRIPAPVRSSGPWLIPAHAGKTAPRKSRPPTRGAHPRSRGENHPAPRGSRTPVGSSPLTRGKRLFRLGCNHRRRLIPAHAGKTVQRRRRTGRRRAHPRSRGENSSCARSRSRLSGSSPLTRGKPSALRRWRATPRLIPAHAGKTSRKAPLGRCMTAHPRSRGENILTAWERRLGMGSSPLTRGKHRMGTATRYVERLIPAHAGKTRSALS